jgi:lactate permease
MVWSQIYNPLGNAWLSTLVAAVPIVVLLGTLGIFRIKAHLAAIYGLIASLLVATIIYGMPVSMAGETAVFGAAFGLMPIGWIILNVIFLYQLTLERGYFKVMQDSIAGVSQDRRLQLLLIAFCFGAFFEGASGFGTPVAVTGAILIGLGFSPLAASGLSLIANTAPVAYGALGTPIIALAAVTGLDLYDLSAMVGRQLPFFSLIVPFWLIWAFAGWRGMLEIWPAMLVAGVSFAIPQYLISNYHGPWLVDVLSSVVSMGCLIVFLNYWRPQKVWTTTIPRGRQAALAANDAAQESGSTADILVAPPRAEVVKAWVPWLILSVAVILWGTPQFKALLDGISVVRIPVTGVHNLIERTPPVVLKPTAEAAIYLFNWLSATGSGILVAAVVAGLVMGFSPVGLVRTYWNTLKLVRYSLLTIACMLAIGFITRYSGIDATLGLAFANTGWLYPLFGTMLGWLGVALTGSDTSSNVLFGSLQRITAEQLGLSPTLMSAANSSGGVMGKMIDAQSIVVASTATRWYGHEGDILRYVFLHSLVLAALVGVLVSLQAYVWPMTALVVR